VGIRRRRGYRSIAVYVPFAVVAMAWRWEHRAFVVEEYIRNGGSVVTTQRAFHIRFKLGRHDPVPVRKTIHVWVSNLRATGSALKKKSPGQPRSVTTPEVVAHVRASIQQSPKRSALKHAAALGLSDRSVSRIFRVRQSGNFVYLQYLTSGSGPHQTK
jgi:transposase